MATLGGTAYTLVDIAKMQDPDGSQAAVAEILNQTNDVLLDMSWMEGNLSTGHRITVRTGLPAPSWRLFNQGVAPTKGTTAQVDEACAMLETFSKVDKDLAELNGNVSAFRLSEARAHLEGMNQEFTQTLFYGNSGTAQEEFTGLAQRYNALGQNCISGGGAGSDNSSIYFICWSPETISGIYPKGSKVGLVHQDMGVQLVPDATGITGNVLKAYVDHFQWKCGLAVKDWRYAVRIANIDISNLVAKSSAADLFDLMIKATHRIPSYGMGKCAFYMNRTCFQMLDIQGRDDVISGGQLQYSMVDGKPVSSFRGFPIRIVDQLLETEATVS